MNRWALCLVCLLSSLFAWGAPAGRDMAAESKIEHQLEQLNPSQLPVFRDARIAMDKGDNAEAERLFAQVTKQVPSFDPAIRRLGNLLVQDGKREEGLLLCRKALALNRSKENLWTLAFCLAVAPTGDTKLKEREEALSLLQASQRMTGGHEFDVLLMTAQLALQLDKMQFFKEATAGLRQFHPDTMQTHYFAAISEAVEEHWIAAEREIRVAQRLGRPKVPGLRCRKSGSGMAGCALFPSGSGRLGCGPASSLHDRLRPVQGDHEAGGEN